MGGGRRGMWPNHSGDYIYMATLNVGAGQTYATLSAAVSASSDGDVIPKATTYKRIGASIAESAAPSWLTRRRPVTEREKQDCIERTPSSRQPASSLRSSKKAEPFSPPNVCYGSTSGRQSAA